MQADADRYQAPSTIYLHNYGMVTLYMLDAVDIKIDIIDINRYLKYIIDINDINIGIYFGHEQVHQELIFVFHQFQQDYPRSSMIHGRGVKLCTFSLIVQIGADIDKSSAELTD